MHLIVSRELLIDYCIEQNPEDSAFASVRDAARARGDRLWVHMATLADLPVRATEALRRMRPDESPDDAHGIVTGRIAEILRDCDVLASLSSETSEIFSARPDLAMAARALHRLGPNARLMVAEGVDRALAGFAGRTSTISPAEYLRRPPEYAPLPFIDLERQQRRIRAGLEEGLHRVLHHGQYILGPDHDALEKRLAEYVGVKHAIAVASGTDALLIALMALDLQPGEEVITVPYTWISTAEVVALLRGRPVFVDVEWDTMNMNPGALEAAITPRTRAIIPVGIFGQCANMRAINAIAAKAGIPVIEDAAQCFGATHHGRRSCGLSLIGCTSFFPSKPLACYGDGGAIFTSDDALADKMRQIRVHGQKVKHQHPLVGLNGRMDTLQAAVVIEKMKVFDDECRRRREVAARYDALLRGAPGVVTPAIRPENTSVYAQYTIRVENPDAVAAHLQTLGIPSVSYYKVPLHLQGAFASLGYKMGDFPTAEKVASQGLSLPMSPYLTEEEQVRIARAVCEGIRAGNR